MATRKACTLIHVHAARSARCEYARGAVRRRGARSRIPPARTVAARPSGRAPAREGVYGRALPCAAHSAVRVRTASAARLCARGAVLARTAGALVHVLACGAVACPAHTARAVV